MALVAVHVAVTWFGLGGIRRRLALTSSQQSLLIAHLAAIERHTADLVRIEAEESAERRQRAAAVSAHRGMGRELLAELLAVRMGRKA